MTYFSKVAASWRSPGWVAVVIAAAVGLGAVPSLAEAQIDLNQFRPSERTKDGFAISTADDMGHLIFGVQVYTDYNWNALAFQSGIANGQTAVVQKQLTGTLQLSLGLWDRLIIYAGLPYHFILRGSNTDDFTNVTAAGIPGTQGAGLGDLWFGARVRLYGEPQNVFNIALQATMNFDTAQAADSAQNYRGDNNKSKLGGHVEAEFVFNALDARLRVPLNVGYRIRSSGVTLGSVNVGDELTYGGALMGTVLDKAHKVVIMAETFGRTGLSTKRGSSGFGTRQESPLEVGAGLKYHHPEGLTVGAAGYAGVLAGYGAPDWRAVAMIGYAMPEDTTPADADADGIPDETDQCPNDAEDLDGFQDDDGCPDPDNDGDGVLDINDGCPNDVEDPDGFQDEDGCPDPDNDGDGVPDTEDKCPNDAGPAELGGCPDPDRDGDGVPDRIDNCPDEPGTVEFKGCKSKQLVELKGDRLEILEKVYFRTASHQVRARSYGLLDNVAAVINAHPEIKTVQVEGHSDSTGSLKFNMRLSKRRAESVVSYLVRKGVDRERLVAEGFGPTRPIVENARTKEQLAANRRVEFNIPTPAPAETPSE